MAYREFIDRSNYQDDSLGSKLFIQENFKNLESLFFGFQGNSLVEIHLLDDFYRFLRPHVGLRRTNIWQILYDHCTLVGGAFDRNKV